MQLTGQNWFTRSLLTIGSCIHNLFFKNRRKAVTQRKLAANERVENSDGEWINQFYEKQCHVFIVLFTLILWCTSDWLFAKVIPICYLQSDPRSHYLHMLALTCPLVQEDSMHLIGSVH